MKQFIKLFWQFSPWRTCWYYWNSIDEQANPPLYKHGTDPDNLPPHRIPCSAHATEIEES